MFSSPLVWCWRAQNPQQLCPGTNVYFPKQRVRLRLSGHPSKLAKYADTVATILDLPTHPNTWFQVELHDGVVAMLRSSSFYSEDPLVDPPSPDCIVESTHTRSSGADSPSLGPGGKRKPKKQINYVGKWVRIVSGRFEGCDGWVTHGRSGYYGVKVVDGPECMKREKDIELSESPHPHLHNQELLDLQESSPTSELSGSTEPVVEVLQPTKKRPRTSASAKVDWIAGQNVRITQGKSIGETGTVVSSGHGFIAVSIHGEQLMKRANELQLEDDFLKKITGALYLFCV